MATAAETIYPHIVRTPGLCSGRPCIVRTRIRVMDVVAEHRRGCTPEQIVQAFPTIATIDVYAALVYYHDHKAEIDADFEADGQLSEQGERAEAEYQSRRG